MWQLPYLARVVDVLCGGVSILPYNYPVALFRQYQVAAILWGPIDRRRESHTVSTLFLEEPSADYHMCTIRCQALHSLGPLSLKTS